MRIAASSSLIKAGASTTRKATPSASALSARMVSSTQSTKRQQGFKPQRADKDDFAETPDSATYRHQHTLPHLPIPTIEATAQKYLDSTRPFLSDLSPSAPVASDAHPTKEYERTKAAVKEFVESPLVRELQQRLQEHAKGKDSWLIDWFNTGSYFGYRDPIVPWVNYYYVHKDDKTRRTGPARAASLIRALLYFRRLVETEVIEPEMIKTTPLDMSTYKYLFNATRIPVKDVDTAKKYDPETNNHIVVVRNGNLYEFEVVDENGEFLSEKDLERQFQRIQDLAKTANNSPVGVLTTENRDTWAQARQVILDASSDNQKALERVESAIVIVALDDSRPITREQISRGIWIGDGRSRWFDKHQLVVFDNGRSGFNGEHSCMDGTPTSRLNDWLLRSIHAKKIDMGSSTATPDQQLPAPKAINFKLNDAAEKAIKLAEEHFDAELGPHKISVLQFNGYGKEFIKKCKTSPDSWAQLVMQYAYYKLSGHSRLAGTYESAQTRKFRRGRTEVIRSATPEALDWVKSMEDPACTNKQRLEYFRKAASAHIRYAGWAADGQGVDRHLYGLKKVMKEGEELPALYTDPAFAASSHWVLSTSQLSSEFFDGWGYGQVTVDNPDYKDGKSSAYDPKTGLNTRPGAFGLAYSVNNSNLRFTITSCDGDTEVMKAYLAEAAEEVRDVITAGMKESEGQAAAKL